MRKILDKEQVVCIHVLYGMSGCWQHGEVNFFFQVRTAFQKFMDSPRAIYTCDHVADGLESQNLQVEMMDRYLCIHLHDTGYAKRRTVDARRVGVSVDCTLATYEERFGNGWMGQMLLQVCNP